MSHNSTRTDSYGDWCAAELSRLAEQGRKLAQRLRDGTQCRANGCCMPRNTNGYCADHSYLEDESGQLLALSMRPDLDGSPSLLDQLNEFEPPSADDDTPPFGVESILLQRKDAPDQQ